MKPNRCFLLAALAFAALALPLAVPAQTVSEDFTGASTTNSWYFFNGACLTAGTSAGAEPSGGGAGQMPGCTAIGKGGSGSLYYNENLVGGYNGVAGSSQTLPDPTGHGALRFTNGSWCTSPSSTSPPGTCTAYSGGFSQNGGIVAAAPFPTGQGIAVTFKTVTYRGNSGGAAGDGADGMSFFLMDATQLNTAAINGVANGDGNGLGSWGGSLGYSCSNSNFPYNGLIGGYIGLGIDEYGNFLNGTANTLSESGTSPSGDNTATGGGYQPGRIGMRGAGKTDQDSDIVVMITPRLVDFTPRKDHMIYAGRGTPEGEGVGGFGGREGGAPVNVPPQGLPQPQPPTQPQPVRPLPQPPAPEPNPNPENEAPPQPPPQP